MKKCKRRMVILIVSLALLLCVGLGLYLDVRRVHLANNDLLLTYESRQAADIVEETVDGVDYTDYLFGEDIGRVIVTGGGEHITIRDNRHGFIKEYRHHVLYGAYDLKKSELFAEIVSYLKPSFWLRGTREVTTRYGGTLRTEAECAEISQWLTDGQYERITESSRNEILVTDSGTYFVN